MNITDYSIILCEGNYNSLDYKIYSKIFDDKTVIPCGANSILKIKELKLKKQNSVCAITDRDFKTEAEIIKLQNEDIYTLKVRAIENLLVANGVIEYICKMLSVKNYKSKIEFIKQTMYEKYGKKLNKQFDIEITKENILEYYNPKKVVDTVAVMLGVSRNDYEEKFIKNISKIMVNLETFISVS